MDLYTLNPNFIADQVVDEYVSAIWTERYSEAGDFQIVCPATVYNIGILAPGTFLALRGTNEVMICESQSIEKKLLTVVGKSLISFLNERFAWFKNPAGATPAAERVSDFTDATRTPGEFISNIVSTQAIAPASLGVGYTAANLDYTNDAIPGLTLGAVDTSGADKRITMPVGPIYDGIQHIAQEEGVGISLYLESADPILGYSLKFKTYRGVDHSVGGAGELIRLDPDMDSLSDLKEVHSIATYKNVAYVYYKGEISEHLAEPLLPEPEGFERRVLVTDATGEPVGRKVTLQGGYQGSGGSYTAYVVDDAVEDDFREQHAKDALANHNYIHAIDGQTSPQNDYKYGVDYGLGDIVELKGITGTITKARITEYIRTQDKTGAKEYPTISVVE